MAKKKRAAKNEIATTAKPEDLEIVDDEAGDADADDADNAKPDLRFAGTPGNRVRASNIRNLVRRGGVPLPEDAAWLADYERARKDGRGVFGASRGRRVSYTEEENEAVGAGTSAVAEMAAAGSMAREEGRRYDYLMSIGLSAMERANSLLERMNATLLERCGQMEQAHVDMMRANAKQYLSGIHAQGEIQRLQTQLENGEKPDFIAGLVEQMMPLLLVKLSGGDISAALPGAVTGATGIKKG